jgi:hypothetical protein
MRASRYALNAFSGKSRDLRITITAASSTAVILFASFTKGLLT